MPSFSDYQATNLAPGWLQDEAGEAWLRAFGAAKDELVARAKEAVKARFPTLAPADALSLIGEERGIDQGATESEASYRLRVRAAWDAWKWAGTPFGLLSALYWAGYRPSSGKVLLQVQLGKQYALRDDYDPAVHSPDEAVVITDLGTVHLGGDPELFNQFAVVFVPPTPPHWLPTPPADASPEIEQIRRLIVRWKPGHARCVSLQVTQVDLWDSPVEPWDPTDELWNEPGANVAWTPPVG